MPLSSRSLTCTCVVLNFKEAQYSAVMLTMANLVVRRGWVLALKLIVLKTRNLESKNVMKVGWAKTGSCLAQSKESS